MNTSPQTTITSDKNKKHSFFYIFIGISFLLTLGALTLSIINSHTMAKEKSSLKQEQQRFFTALKNEQNAYHEEMILRIKQDELSLNQLMTQSSNISLEQARAEADSLIYLAELKLRYTSNVSDALQLLQLALQKLTPFHTPEMDEKQQRLKFDIEVLKKIPAVNQAELLAKIDALMLRIKLLPLVFENSSQAILYSTEAPTDPWWGKVKSNLEKIKSFVVIRKIDDAQTLALSPSERQFVKQTMLIKLAQAQWAVLNKQKDVYQQSLHAAKSMLASLGLPHPLNDELNSLVDQLRTAPIAPIVKLTIIQPIPAPQNTQRPAL